MQNQPDQSNPIPSRRQSPIQTSPSFDTGAAQEFGTAALTKGKGFLGALFDFSFNHFITVKMARILFGFLLLVAAIQTLLFTGAMFQISTTAGLFFMVFLMIPIFIVMAVFARLWVELIVVLFRIGEHAAEIARSLRESSPGSGTSAHKGDSL